MMVSQSPSNVLTPVITSANIPGASATESRSGASFASVDVPPAQIDMAAVVQLEST